MALNEMKSDSCVIECKIEYRKEDGSRVTDVLNLPQAEYERLMDQYRTKYHKEKKYEPFSVEQAQKLANMGEELAVKGHIKTDGFEKAIVFLTR